MIREAIKFISILLISGLSQGLMAQGDSITFSATGDVPYDSSEVLIFQRQIADHNLYSPSEFFVHLGDIKRQSDPCDEHFYSDMAGYLKELAVPVFIVPGDNETTDCTNEEQARAYWEQYFMDFELNFCDAPSAEKQPVRPENFGFVRKGVLFIGIDLVSEASDSTMTDDADWVEQQFQQKVSQVRGAVIFSQCGPDSSRSLFFNRFVPAAQTFGKPVLFLHGDGHSWKKDNPFSASNVLRVQVNNGGDEDPVQVTVTMDPQEMFALLRNPFSSNPQVYNVMPCVKAHADQQIVLAPMADLRGEVTDDGVPTPPGTLTTTWSKSNGPGTVTFDNPNDVVTSVSFSLPGDYLLRLTADDGELQDYDEVMVTVSEVPNKFQLHQNYPNPFNPATTLRFDIPATGSGIIDTRLIIYNSIGQAIKTLYQDKLSAGSYEVRWDGTTDFGNRAPNGIYFAVFRADRFFQTRKLLLLK